MKLSRNRFVKYTLALIVVALVSGLTIGFYFGQPQKGGKYFIGANGEKYIFTPSNIVTVTAWPRVHIEVSPISYPNAGQYWTIFVYSVNITSDKVYLTPLPNSTIVAIVKENGSERNYNLITDSKGQAQFQYLTTFTDVAFQASKGTEESGRIVISSHYVSSDSIDAILGFSSLLTSATMISISLVNRTDKVLIK